MTPSSTNAGQDTGQDNGQDTGQVGGQDAAAEPIEAEVSPSGPLAGVTVLDLSRILAGPTATQLLGDLGAEIIKIERPGGGDDTRSWGPPFAPRPDGERSDLSAYFMSANRNKRSVTVDISTPAGADVIRSLAAQADILIENYKVGGLAKYGLAYPDLAAAYPRLIYCSITGFGQTGPNAHRAGYDLLAQGEGGIMSLTGAPEGEPMKVAVGVADVVCGLYAVSGILAALHHRNQTGQGQHIDIGLIDAQVAWLINEGVNYLTSGQPPIRRGNQHPNIVPYQVFAVADGHVIVACGNDSQFAKLMAILGRAEIAEDPAYATNPARLANREALLALMTPLLLATPKAELIAAMAAQGVPGGPINTLPEVFEAPQTSARGLKIDMPQPAAASGVVSLIGNPLNLSETPVAYRRAPPTLGADTEAVLRARLGDAAFDAARARGAFGATE